MNFYMTLYILEFWRKLLLMRKEEDVTLKFVEIIWNCVVQRTQVHWSYAFRIGRNIGTI